MIVLEGVDRFMVELSEESMRWHDVERRSMSLIQLQKAEIANVAFDIIDLTRIDSPA